MSGCLYGVGLGPGDPELITLKAARIISQTRLIAYFQKRGGGHARAIAASLMNGHHEELPLNYPVTTEYKADDPRYETLIHDFYEKAAGNIAARLKSGEDVAVLCEGDPFFYGSFMHLYRRLAQDYPCHVVPGITGMSGGWTNAGTPIAWGNDVFTVIPGTLDSESLARRFKSTDAAAVIKLGRNLPRVRAALAEAGLIDRAIYIEYGTMAAERILPLHEKLDDNAPYFSLIVVPGEGRRL
ncbi:MAG: precorrin-2 C(20)-methyltransferase [Pseudomonadota bacterium]|nr:precorrin-2 C(20)-methyltransferase [Pseudomonadota bacterium]